MDGKLVVDQAVMGESAPMRKAAATPACVNRGLSAADFIRPAAGQGEYIAKDGYQKPGLLSATNGLPGDSDFPQVITGDHPVT